MHMRLAAPLLLLGAPSLAQPGPLPSIDQAAASMDQAQWGNLTELAGRDFVYHNSMLVTFRWIESAGYVEMVYWAGGGRSTLRLQPDPAEGVIKLLNVGPLGTSTIDRFRTAADGALFSVTRSGAVRSWLEGDPISGFKLNGTPLEPIVRGSKQAAKIERLIAEGKLAPGAPVMQVAAPGAGYAATTPVRQGAVTAIAQTEAEFEPEPEPAPEIDPETGAIKQTPAGAIRFLDTLAQQGALTILHLWNAGQGTEIYSKLEHVRRKSDCQAMLFGKLDRISSETGQSYQAGTPEFAYVIKQVSSRSLFGSPPYAIDWSKVLSVSYGGLSARSSNDEQTVLVNGPQGVELALRLPDRALAKRAHYAITFLREACDRTAETGF